MFQNISKYAELYLPFLFYEC